MSTAPLTAAYARTRARSSSAVAERSEKAPLALAAALLLLITYAAFAHGAVGTSSTARIEVALAAIAAAAGTAWLWTGGLRLVAPRLAVAGVLLLGAFAVWSGVSVLWSVSADQTWIELNRAVGYVLVLCLSIALGASHRRAVDLVGRGFVLIALVVSVYALGQKVLPGLHVAGVIDLNQTGSFPRLQEPLGYWNALALFLVLAVPAALALTTDMGRSPRARLGMLLALQLVLLAVGLTYSRGGLVALVVAMLVGVGLSGARLRSLMWLSCATAAALPALVLALTNHSLTAANVPLGRREGAGGVLLAVLLISALALLVGGHRLQTVESRAHLGETQVRRVGISLGVVVAVLAACGVLAVAVSSRGLGGTVSHAWHSFTTTRETSNDPSRLLSADSENRWVWWTEAAGAFSARPLAGWGAGSFAVVHLRYRSHRLAVTQPHSVPLQFLSETGVVGAVLALLAFGLLLATALRRVRRSAGPARMLEAALLAGAAAYVVHSFYDWDWDIPAVTLPALAFLGVLAGGGPTRGTRSAPAALRGLMLAGLTLWLCVFASSSVLPSLATSKASGAVVAAASDSPGEVQHAQASAELASQLDPLSDAGLKVQATVAVRRGEVPQAIQYLLAAVTREPSDVQAWESLAFLEFEAKDFPAARRAALRGLQLDPLGSSARAAARRTSSAINLTQSPPRDSPTGRPLPLGGGR